MPGRFFDDARPAEAVETCRIHRWRGYVKSTFYAVTPSGAVLAESRSFRWRRKDEESPRERARKAYDELTEELAADGWTPADPRGREWYGAHFVRTLVAAHTEPGGDQALEARVPPPAAFPTQLRPPSPVASWPAPPELPLAPFPSRPAPARAEDAPATAAADPVPSGDRETETEPAHETPTAPPHRRRRRRALAAIGSLGSAGVAAALLMGGLHVNLHGTPSAAAAHKERAQSQQRPQRAARKSLAQPTKRPARARPTPSKPAKATPVKKRPAQPTSTPARAAAVDLRIRAHGTGSWVEIRRGSKSGSVLYAGVLNDGRRLHFHATRLWMRLGAAGNLSITANGKPISLRGTYDKLLTADSA